MFSSILQMLVLSMTSVALYSLIAVGLNMIYGVMNMINISQGSFMMIGMYVTFWLFVLYGIDPTLSLVVVAPIGFLCGVIVQRTVAAPLVKSAKSRREFLSSTLLVTFGLSMLMQGLAMNFWSRDLRSYEYLTSMWSFLDVNVTLVRVVVFIVSILSIGMIYYFLRVTYLGKAMRAVSSDRRGASLLGIPTGKLDMICFGIGLSLACVAGSLFSMMNMFSPAIGFDLTLKGLCIIILGGLGSIRGALVGAIILAVSETVASYFISAIWGFVISFVILLILLVFKPRGIST